MEREAAPAKRLVSFFLLIYVLSVPFWVLGEAPLPLPVNLPASALAFVTPLLAALILTYWRGGLVGTRALLGRAFDFRRIKNPVWLVPALLLIPSIYFAAYLLMRLAQRELPVPDVPLLMAPVFFLGYFVTAVCEELGWMGYAVDPLQERWGALRAALLLGIVWELWHLIPHLQQGLTAGWIAWQSLYSIALRVLIVWVYNNTGRSVFAAVLVHTMDNVSWSLFPNFGSHYDPLFTAVVAWATTAAVILLWGAQTLARFRYGRLQASH